MVRKAGCSEPLLAEMYAAILDRAELHRSTVHSQADHLTQGWNFSLYNTQNMKARVSCSKRVFITVKEVFPKTTRDVSFVNLFI